MNILNEYVACSYLIDDQVSYPVNVNKLLGNNSPLDIVASKLKAKILHHSQLLFCDLRGDYCTAENKEDHKDRQKTHLVESINVVLG